MVLKRLVKEIENLEKDDLISNSHVSLIIPDDSNMHLWHLHFQGPTGSIFEEFEFSVKVQFPADYPLKPPVLVFITKLFHPNVTTNGQICLDVLQDKWSPTIGMVSIISQLIMLLSEPIPDGAVNGEAANLMKSDYELFARTAIKYIKDNN